MFFPAYHLKSSQIAIRQTSLDGVFDFSQRFFVFPARFFYFLLKYPVTHGMVGGEAQILQFQTQFVHPQAIRDGCVNVQGFFCDASAALRRHDA